MAITSQQRAAPTYGDILLTDWQTAGLLKTSTVKPVFATLEQNLIVRHMGTLTPVDQKTLRERKFGK